MIVWMMIKRQEPMPLATESASFWPKVEDCLCISCQVLIFSITSVLIFKVHINLFDSFFERNVSSVRFFSSATRAPNLPHVPDRYLISKQLTPGFQVVNTAKDYF